MNELLQLLLKGDPGAYAVVFCMGFLISRMVREVLHEMNRSKAAEGTPYPPSLDMGTLGQVAGIDWNDARTVGYLSMSQHVIMAESEFAKALAGPAVFREGIAMPPPPREVPSGTRQCEYCQTWEAEPAVMSCGKCGARLSPNAPKKPVEWPAPTTPGWSVR